MFTFNISIFIFTILIIISAVYFKVYRAALVVAAIYLLFSTIILFSSKDKEIDLAITTVDPSIIPDTLIEKVDTISTVKEIAFDSTQLVSKENLYEEPMDSKSDSIKVRSMKISRDIEISERKPVDIDNIFSIDNVDTLYCFTAIKNSTDKNIKVIHIWEYNGKEVAQVSMNVSPSVFWRCWSSKRIYPNHKGQWRVSITDDSYRMLDEILFEVI